MKLRVALSLLLLFAASVTASAMDSQTCVLVDRSGSMSPHYAPIGADATQSEAPLVKVLASSMVNAAAVYAKPDIAVFDTRVVALRDLNDVENFHVTHNDTALTSALQDALRSHRHIWLLTDNVQDIATPGKPHNQDMSQFYSLLRSPQIRSIHIFPVLERADLKQQGVLVYAISTVDDAVNGRSSDFDKEIAAFKQQLSDSPRLHPLQVQELWMKPLGRHALDVAPEHFDGPRQFDVGDTLKLQAKVVITAKPYLYFEDSPVNTDTGSVSDNVFAGATCLDVERKQASVSPTTVRTDSTVVYTVAVDYGRVRLHSSLGCIWNAAFVSSQVSRQIGTPLTVRVPKGRFHFTPAFDTRFTADSEPEAQAQGKIAGLKDLPEELADEETVIPLFVPAQVVIRYPAWPGFLLGGVALLLAASVVGILVASTRVLGGQKSRVTVQLASGGIIPSSMRGDTLLVNNRNIGRVQGARFSASPDVRLDEGGRNANTTQPIRCTLPDARRIIIIFGAASSASDVSGSPAAPTSTPPRQAAAPRRR